MAAGHARHHARVRVLLHIRKLDDCFGDFVVRVSCPCGLSRHIAPEALARIAGRAAKFATLATRDALHTMRAQGGRGGGRGEAEAARRGSAVAGYTGEACCRAGRALGAVLARSSARSGGSVLGLLATARSCSK